MPPHRAFAAPAPRLAVGHRPEGPARPPRPLRPSPAGARTAGGRGPGPAQRRELPAASRPPPRSPLAALAGRPRTGLGPRRPANPARFRDLGSVVPSAGGGGCPGATGDVPGDGAARPGGHGGGPPGVHTAAAALAADQGATPV